MINGVKLILLDQPFEMWKFKCDNPVRRQQTGHSGGEVVEIGHLRQYVIADDEIGHAAFRYETPGETQSEKIDQCWTFLRRAASATLAAGSIPSTGTPSGKKC